jgi:hypothetical protein
MSRKKLEIILFIIYILLILNIKYPVIRFEVRMYNLLFTVAFLLTPILIFIRAFYVKNIIAKIFSIIITAIIAFFSTILALFLVMNIQFIKEDEYDYSFECINRIQNEEYVINTYRINGGATTSYSVAVRQEKSLILGMLLVREIYYKYRQYDVELYLDGSVLIIDNCKYNLKENIYY